MVPIAGRNAANSRMARHNPSRLPFIIALCLISGATGLLWWMEISVLYAYLLGIIITTFLFYEYDKRQSLKKGRRVPEAVLHVLALAGGSPGALAGMISFRHKTKKLKFKMIFAAILILQVIVGCWYWTNVMSKLK